MISKKNIYTIGELLWDVPPSGPILGGAPANVAARLTVFKHKPFLVSRVGEDDLGKKIVSDMDRLGVDIRLVQKDLNKPTGTVPVELTDEGNPRFTILQDVAYDYLEWVPELDNAATNASAIVYGTLIQRSPVSRKTLYQFLSTASNAFKFLDLNLRKDCYTRETVEASLKAATIAKMNRDEVKRLFELFELKGRPSEFEPAVINHLLTNFNLEGVVVTLGEKGARAIMRDGRDVTVPGRSVTVVDTIGAGDAFSAGFVAAYLENRSIEECLKYGNVLGSLAATTRGGMGYIDPRLVATMLNRVEQNAA